MLVWYFNFNEKQNKAKWTVLRSLDYHWGLCSLIFLLKTESFLHPWIADISFFWMEMAQEFLLLDSLIISLLLFFIAMSLIVNDHVG